MTPGRYDATEMDEVELEPLIQLYDVLFTSGKCYPMLRGTQVNNLLLNGLYGFAGFDGGGTGQTTNPAQGCFFLFEKWVGVGKRFLFHDPDFKPLLSKQI